MPISILLSPLALGEPTLPHIKLSYADAALTRFYELKASGFMIGAPPLPSKGPNNMGSYYADEMYLSIEGAIDRRKESLLNLKPNVERSSASDCEQIIHQFQYPDRWWRRNLLAAVARLGTILRLGKRSQDQLVRRADENAWLEAEIATIARQRLSHLTGTPVFADVSIKHWAWLSVPELGQAGILAGYPDGTFKP